MIRVFSMGERLKKRQCTRLNLATKTKREINLKFQESQEERFANYGINPQLWSLYRGFSLLRSGFLVYVRSDHINLPTETQNYDSLFHSSYNSHHQEPNFDRTLQAN
ncbi:uncharacterized protein LOC110748563 [Prunus avium]|uniref:Uncharacterized protein LOC110748308 n=1 Tax=Prunus avium TaxID=42229 RepID=A0A6P5RT62_PRUAV|nr:uncharacterized protein LOC110748308 [Prunus avium]XP_021804221.1 uncharacterized protein LOC110748563 [Prunus avium]